MATEYLICYDIRNIKRLTKVHKVMLSYGIPVQKSVFYAYLIPKRHQQLVSKLNDIIDCAQDEIKMYPIHACNLQEWPKASMTGNKDNVFIR